MDQLPILIPVPPLAAALVTPLVGRRWPHVAFLLTLAAAAGATAAATLGLVHVLEDGTTSYLLGGWAPPLGIEYVLDRVSAFVALVVTTVSLVTIMATRRWALREAGDRIGPFYSLVLLLLAGLTGIVVTGDLFNLFVFLEISSLAAYTLVFFSGRRSMVAGFRYLILGAVGGSFYLLGVGFIFFATGTLNMADAQQILTAGEPGRAVQAGAVLIFTGLGLKMALVPLHLWLPDAYYTAASSVNTVIAPVMTKTAAYAMLRMFLSVFPDGYLEDVVPVAGALLVLGLIGVIFGAVMAISQTDIRRMLAYSSVGQLAMIAVGIGLATPLGFVAALVHIMNHAVIKATLFVSVASVRLTTGNSHVDGFAGLGRRMPWTMAAFTMAAIAMVGVPPAAGFFSKWYLAQAGASEGEWAVVGIVLGSSLLSAVYLFKVLERAYLRPAGNEHRIPGAQCVPSGAAGDDPGPEAPAHASQAPQAPSAPVTESPADMVAPALLLGVSSIVLGLANAFIVTNVLEAGVS